MSTENNQEQKKTEAELVQEFIQKLNEALNQLIIMQHRLSETEKVAGYLLSKDPEWVAQMQAAMAEEQKQADRASAEAAPLVLPE